jgi:hypothetical protein
MREYRQDLCAFMKLWFSISYLGIVMFLHIHNWDDNRSS